MATADGSSYLLRWELSPPLLLRWAPGRLRLSEHSASKLGMPNGLISGLNGGLGDVGL